MSAVFQTMLRAHVQSCAPARKHAVGERRSGYEAHKFFLHWSGDSQSSSKSSSKSAFTQAALSQCNPDCTLTVEEILVNDTLLQNLLCKQEQIVRRKPSNRKTAPGETLRGITSSKSSKSISRPCAACINRRSARNYALGSCLREGNRRRLPACYLQTTGRLSSMI